MTRFRITENRIYGPTLLETTNGEEAKLFCLSRGESRLYLDDVNVAIILVDMNVSSGTTAMTARFWSAYPTFDSLFE